MIAAGASTFLLAQKSCINITFEATEGRGTPSFRCTLNLWFRKVSGATWSQRAKLTGEGTSLGNNKERVHVLMFKGKFIPPFPNSPRVLAKIDRPVSL